MCIYALKKKKYDTVHANNVYGSANRTVYLFIMPNLTVLQIWYAMNINMVHMSIYRKYGLVWSTLQCT